MPKIQILTWAENWGLRPLWGLRPPIGGGGLAGSPSNTMSSGPRAEAYLRTKWQLDPCSRLAAMDIGRKLGSSAHSGRGAGSQSNTKSPGLRPTSMAATDMGSICILGMSAHLTFIYPLK